jgi:hypothetical protein
MDIVYIRVYLEIYFSGPRILAFSNAENDPFSDTAG